MTHSPGGGGGFIVKKQKQKSPCCLLFGRSLSLLRACFCQGHSTPSTNGKHLVWWLIKPSQNYWFSFVPKAMCGLWQKGKEWRLWNAEFLRAKNHFGTKQSVAKIFRLPQLFLQKLKSFLMECKFLSANHAWQRAAPMVSDLISWQAAGFSVAD